nr:MAG TPA: hypothetical protein [Caudoviricetes sp.]
MLYPFSIHSNTIACEIEKDLAEEDPPNKNINLLSSFLRATLK